MFQFRKMKSGVNLFECTVLWTLVCVSYGLNNTSSTGGKNEDRSNIDITLLVVFITVFVCIIPVLFVLYKNYSSSMLNISRDIHLRKVNMFEDSFLGIKTRIERQCVDHSPLYLDKQSIAMKGRKSSGRILQARHADHSINTSFEYQDGLHVPIYPMKDKSPRGLAVIIGIDEFNSSSLDNLPVVKHDRDMVKATFEAIKFEVVECRNHDKQGITKFLLNISEKNDIIYDCFVCYISSHGFKGHICCKDCDDETSKGILEIGFVIGLFTNDICETFAGKPKVFVFDICLGDKEIKYKPLSKGPTEKQYKDEEERNAAFAHILICFATIPGYVSYTAYHGSRFTKAFTYAIDKASHKTSMDDIMYAINHKMATTKEDDLQIPSFANKLVKKLVFKENLR